MRAASYPHRGRRAPPAGKVAPGDAAASLEAGMAEALAEAQAAAGAEGEQATGAALWRGLLVGEVQVCPLSFAVGGAQVPPVFLLEAAALSGLPAGPAATG